MTKHLSNFGICNFKIEGITKTTAKNKRTKKTTTNERAKTKTTKNKLNKNENKTKTTKNK